MPEVYPGATYETDKSYFTSDVIPGIAMQGTGTLREIEELFLFDSADFLSGSNAGGVRNGGAAVNGYASNSGSSGSSPASTVESGIHFVDSDAEQRQRLSSGESDAEVLDEIMRHSSSHNAADTGGALTATTAYPIIHEQQSEPGQLTTLTYRELRSSPPDLSTGSVGHLSCSGESGYFDQANSDFSDLQVFLEGESGIPHLQHLPQPEQPHQLLPAVPHPQQTAIKADPGSLEWSYLEPAQPLLSSSVSGVPMRPPMNNQIVIPGSFAADSDDDIWIMSGSHVQWPEPLVVKSEPMASPQEHLATNAGQFYSNPVPVQLLKRDYVQDQSPTSECSPHLSSGPPPPQLAHSYEPPMKRSSPPSSSSSYAPPSDESRLCHVCGEKAGKHSYYGGQVCPSCRAFFRRSVQSK